MQDSTTVTFLTVGHVKTLTGGASVRENEPVLLPRRALSQSLSLFMYISPSLSRGGTNTGVERAEEIEDRSAYHLHGKPGNSSWKIKWYASLHLEYFWNYGLLVKVMHFYYSGDLQLMFIHFSSYPSSIKTSKIISYLCRKFPFEWFA